MTTPHPILADFLDQRRESITAQWLRRVQEDRNIPSADDLPRAELIDHLPFLMNALIERLRGTPHAGSETSRQSQAHGETRAQQHYQLPELLREVSILRNILIEVWVEFDIAHGPERRAQLESSTILHTILDEVIAESTIGFVESQRTELLATNHALEQANLQAEALNVQLAMLDERRLRTLRTISHEIANHLNAAGLMLSMLERAPDSASTARSLASIHGCIAAMTVLMKQLLEFSLLASAGEKAALQKIPLPPLYRDLEELARSHATKGGLTFHGDLEPTLDEVVTDPDILHRIVLNLITNAVKYTPTGGIHLAFQGHDPGHWRIEVRDTGCGISPEEQSRIFDEFYRSKSVSSHTPGVGLGLAITQQLTTLLGGRIEVESTVGVGSTFRVVLPRSS